MKKIEEQEVRRVVELIDYYMEPKPRLRRHTDLFDKMRPTAGIR